MASSNVNTNYFSNQTMGVNSLENLHKTKFHYTPDMILTKGLWEQSHHSLEGGTGSALRVWESHCRCSLIRWTILGQAPDWGSPSSLNY